MGKNCGFCGFDFGCGCCGFSLLFSVGIAIMKTFNFGSRFFFLSGAASVAALVGGSVVGAVMIVGLVAVAYKY